mmetsp:Transcript_6889/g.18757  ORF Transcript_6889/g.18757 Transcript_6889/m.18757 type:complete len:1126 (+) Transcript_6889:86-3463(+)
MNTSTGRGSPVNEASRINMSTHLRGCRHLLLDDVRSLGGVRLRRRHQLPKLGQVLRPSREHSLTLGRTRLRDVLLDESLELRLALSGADALHGDNLTVNLGREGAVLVEEVPNAASHARADVPPDAAQHHHAAARHVLAAVIARAFHDSLGQRVSHREPLTRPAVEKRLAAGGSVQARVTRDDAILGVKRRRRRGRDGNRPAGHRLAHVVVRLADEFHVDAVDGEPAEGLTGGSLELDVERPREARVAVFGRDGSGDSRGGASIGVDDLLLDRELTLLRDALDHAGILEDLVVEHAAVVVRRHRAARGGQSSFARGGGEEGEVQAGRLGGLPGRRSVGVHALLREQIVSPDDFVEGLVPHGRELLANFLGAQLEKVDEVAGRAWETSPEFLALGRDTDWAVVGVADARHDAPGGDHGDGTEAVLVGAHERALDDVQARAAAAVGAEHHSLAQVILDERPVRLDEAHLHGTARVLDGGEGRGARAAVAAGDLDDVGVSLGDAGRDCADARLAHELHGNLSLGVHHVQVVDELREILDGVDVVVGRRGDEGHASLGTAKGRDVGRNLLAGELTALAGLGALRNLNLELIRSHEERGGDAEAAGRHLLDSGRCDVASLETVEVGKVVGVTVGVRGDGLVALGILATLARVGLAADSVHRDGDRLVALARDGTQRHASGAEPRADVADGLDLVDVDGLPVALDHEHVAEGGGGPFVALLLVELVRVKVTLLLLAPEPDSLVEELGHLLVVGVVLEAGLDLEHTARGDAAENLVLAGKVGSGEERRLRREVIHAHAADTGDGTLEGDVDHLGSDAVALQNLCAVVRGEERDAHLGEDFLQSLVHRRLVVALHVGDGHVGHLAALDGVLNLGGPAPLAAGLEREPRVHRGGAKADEAREVMGGKRRRRLHDDGRSGSEANLDEVVVNRTHREHGRDRGHRRVAAIGPVGDDHRLGSVGDRLLGGGAEIRDSLGHLALPARSGVTRGDADGGELLEPHDGLDVLVEEHRGLDVHRGDVLRALVVQEVTLGAQGHLEGHDEPFAEGINRRVGDLRESLLEVIVEEMGPAGEHRHGGIVTHRPRGLHAVGSHGLDDHGHILGGVPGGGLRFDQADGVHGGRLAGILGVEKHGIL